MNKVDKEVGDIFQQRRRELRLTQNQLGEKVGLAGSTIACYEKGLRGMGLETFFGICDALGLDPNHIHEMVRTGSGYAFGSVPKKM